MKKAFLPLLIALALAFSPALAAPLESQPPMELTASSAMLLEADTGAVIFEQNADERRQVASVTKLMTLLLCMEELESGAIRPEDPVTISQNAAAQIGSQALLDAGSVYTVETLLHATIIASANDAACALAEHLCGSEGAFAQRMNQRAEELGMQDTCYTNATGLPDDGQYTTARDVSILCRQVCLHPQYFEHASVWMDTLTHPSGRTTDLTNTNRLVRFYDGCDGLKTGSSDASRYCLCATAKKDGLRLIAIVLGVPVSQTRFNEARAMLDYGFQNYKRVTLLKKGDLLGSAVPVRLGLSDQVEAAAGSGISMLLRTGQEKQLSIQVELPPEVTAPIAAGDALGVVRVRLGDSVIAKTAAVAASDVPMPGLLAAFLRLAQNWR